MSCTEHVCPVRLLAEEEVWLLGVKMDISVLPNNNHPEKFLQLDVGMLPASYSMYQFRALMSSQKHWQNRVYFQVWMLQHDYLPHVCTNYAD